MQRVHGIWERQTQVTSWEMGQKEYAGIFGFLNIILLSDPFLGMFTFVLTPQIISTAL